MNAAPLVLSADRLLAPEEVTPALLAVAGGKVVAVGEAAVGLGPQVSLRGTLVPALVDLQVNGGAGVDLQQPGADRARLHAWLAEGGILTYAPTIVSAPVDHMRSLLAGLEPCRLGGVEALRPHLEGPFISGDRLGAHDARAAAAATAEEVVELAAGASMVTLAPERPGANALVAALVAAGTRVAAGHSDATFEQAEVAFAAGVTAVTHLFNAMAPLDRREPGLAGAALMGAGRPFAGMIADGIHVHPAMARLAAAVLRERLFLVSDAAPDADMGTGQAQLADGTLAGSVTRLDAGLRNLLAWGVEAPAAVRAVTATPAAAIGLQDRGALQPGRLALVALLDPEFGVLAAGPAEALAVAPVAVP